MYFFTDKSTDISKIGKKHSVRNADSKNVVLSVRYEKHSSRCFLSSKPKYGGVY